MKWEIKCGKKFEVKVVSEKNGTVSDLVKIATIIVVTVMLSVTGFAAYGAVSGDYTAFDKVVGFILEVLGKFKYDG